jgi:sugar phosphate isomerase/epimerase
MEARNIGTHFQSREHTSLGALGVCSWSLHPTSATDLAAKVNAAGLHAVQLHLDPIRTGAWNLDQTRSALATAGIDIISGMMAMKGEDYSTLESIRLTGGVRIDTNWEENLHAAGENAALAEHLGVRLVTFHAGFLPHDLRDPLRAVMLERLRKLSLVFGSRGVGVALETGQEDAPTLLGVLEELNAKLAADAAVGVNFDPANMILYGMGDPALALRSLAPFVRQIHVKDAVPAPQPGIWGEEVPAGTGSVQWVQFLELIRSLGLRCPLVIEREAGDKRGEDVATARRIVEGAM